MGKKEELTKNENFIKVTGLVRAVAQGAAQCDAHTLEGQVGVGPPAVREGPAAVIPPPGAAGTALYPSIPHRLLGDQRHLLPSELPQNTWKQQD